MYSEKDEEKTVEPDVIEESEPVNVSPFYPAKVDCLEPVSVIVDRLTSDASKDEVFKKLENLQVQTVGAFCALPEETVRGLGLELPETGTLIDLIDECLTPNDRMEETPVEAAPTNPSPVSEEVLEPMEKQSDEAEMPSDSFPNGQVICK